jgi:hypothetical protein
MQARRTPALSDFCRRDFRRVVLVLDRLGEFVVERRFGAAAQRRIGLEAGDRQKPGGDAGATLEPGRLAPDIKEDLGDDVFRDILASDEPQDETMDAEMMRGEQGPHRGLIPLGNLREELIVLAAEH